jgi:transposase
MKRRHFIGVDVHCLFCEIAVVDERGRKVSAGRCPTTIPALAAELDKVPRPCALVIEEGPLADWLARHLRPRVDDLVVSEPRRNRLIARDGDKDDPLDAEKLAQLYRGGYVKAVHHTDSLPRALFKQHVGLYHDAVRQRVREALRVSSLLRRHGVFVREKAFADRSGRAALLRRLPPDRGLRCDVRLLWKGYDVMAAVEVAMRRQLVELAKQQEVVCRFVAVPGIAWVRAATLYAWLDTPWRFRSKSALWKYLGIGLERRRSGSGPEFLAVPLQVNRTLKGTILGAAKSAAARDDNPFADQYRRWIEAGLSPKLARRNVARSLAATVWGLWKNGTAYRPEWVGVAAAAVRAAAVSP